MQYDSTVCLDHEGMGFSGQKYHPKTIPSWCHYQVGIGDKKQHQSGAISIFFPDST